LSKDLTARWPQTHFPSSITLIYCFFWEGKGT